ncbi:MAG: cytochrome c [Deltaproteobacteria bacterium]|nr:cytochrome c [Deltaproteobacteria bacterium]MBW2499910.1 cytochrome c [Deltaproteobacteria bacterium]
MTRVRSVAPFVGLAALLFAGALVGGSAGLARAADEGTGSAAAGLPDAERGRRVLAATGGCTCHTNYPGEGDDAPALAGGRAMETPFGVYYSTNITPDRETGIGGWSDEDFIRAMREGLSPEGEHYFPVFPYTSFAGLTDQDLVDLKAHLFTLPAVQRENRPPDAGIPFRWRWTIAGWKWMNFDPQPIEDDPDQSEAWNRGRYLVHAAAHCGECHTPRTLSGGLDTSMWLAGSREGPEGELAPNITPDSKTGIGGWSTPDIVWYLETGLKPDGDDTQGLMSEVIEHGYSNLAASELKAIGEYLRSLPAIENEVKGKP